MLLQLLLVINTMLAVWLQQSPPFSNIMEFWAFGVVCPRHLWDLSLFPPFNFQHLPKPEVIFKIENHTIKRTYKYSIIAEFVTAQGCFKEGSVINAFIASLLSGLLVSVAMAPFDLVSTRFYNQGVDANGKGMGKKLANKSSKFCAFFKGLTYSTVRNCAWKIFQAEGTLGFFKGWTAIYFRLGE